MVATIVSAVNDHGVLNSCLMRSPEVASGVEVLLKQGFASASTAYNEALNQANGEVVVFVHQDVFLPSGWMEQFVKSLQWLQQHDPEWGVLGVYGVAIDAAPRGWVYSAGLGRILGRSFSAPEEVRTLDEVLLVVRRSSGMRFDEGLPGFHMYGTDICLEAEKRGLKNYVIPGFAIHNSNGIKSLPVAFWKAYLFVRRKWRSQLPVHAPCAVVTRSLISPAKQILSRTIRLGLRRSPVGRRVPDPEALYRQLRG